MSGSSLAHNKQTPLDINKDRSKIRTGTRIVSIKKTTWYYYLSTHVRSKAAYFRDKTTRKMADRSRHISKIVITNKQSRDGEKMNSPLLSDKYKRRQGKKDVRMINIKEKREKEMGTKPKFS